MQCVFIAGTHWFMCNRISAFCFSSAGSISIPESSGWKSIPSQHELFSGSLILWCISIWEQASYITGGVYLKPQVSDGLFQYLSVSVIKIINTKLSLFVKKNTKLSLA